MESICIFLAAQMVWRAHMQNKLLPISPKNRTVGMYLLAVSHAAMVEHMMEDT
jgi:hypothetical protein